MTCLNRSAKIQRLPSMFRAKAGRRAVNPLWSWRQVRAHVCPLSRQIIARPTEVSRTQMPGMAELSEYVLRKTQGLLKQFVLTCHCLGVHTRKLSSMAVRTPFSVIDFQSGHCRSSVHRQSTLRMSCLRTLSRKPLSRGPEIARIVLRCNHD